MSDEELHKEVGAAQGEERHMSIDLKNGKQSVIAEDGEVLTTIDPKAESRLVWKFDLRLLPILAVMYLFNRLVAYLTILELRLIETTVWIRVIWGTPKQLGSRRI